VAFAAHGGDAPLSHLAIGAKAPDFSAAAADGQRHALSEYAGRIVVLEWTSPVCPFTAVKYSSGAMQALQRFAAETHAVWLSVDSAAAGRAGYLSASAARARIRDTHATVTAFLFDRDARMARQFGAKTTPSFFIIDRDGRLAYQGAMDQELTDEVASARNYVHEALEDLVAHRPVRLAQTPQRGCAVEY
jgi:peroxiredoxin